MKNIHSISLFQWSEKKKKYNDSISNSMNVELHKKLILSNIATTFMPYMAFQQKFQNDDIVAVPVTDTDSLLHCLMYSDDPDNDNKLLLETFILFLYDAFFYHFGSQIIGKRPYNNTIKNHEY